MRNQKLQKAVAEFNDLPTTDEGLVIVDAEIVTKIRQLDTHIFTAKGRLKILREEQLEKLNEHTAHKELVVAQLAVETAKKNLERVLIGDGDYNNLLERIADEKDDIRETGYTLSLYLVEWYAQTHQKQIEIGAKPGDAKEVLITGKLGKTAKFQTRLFSQGSVQ